MRIDVFSDVVCPWCFIGKRRLDAALAAAGISDADIQWRAYQLNPDIPPGGLDRLEYMRKKFGGPEAIARIHERVSEAGRSVGIEFQWDKIRRSPNTLDAHRLLKLAGSRGRQNEVKDALFRAYFLQGCDVGDRTVLAAVAAESGVTDDVSAWLQTSASVADVREDLSAAARLQISGVPFFIFAGRYALPGAQSPEIFAQALAAARDTAAIG